MAAILILEDDFDLAAAWKRTLIDYGHKPELCHTSSEAIALDEAEEFEVFVVDLMITVDVPDMSDSGVTFLRHLVKKHPDLRQRPPVIGVSGFKPLGTASPVGEFFKAYGVQHFMLKPFSATDLAATVYEVLAD
ncbi:MAG: response regulator [Pseudomonadota bacterium]